MAPLGRDEKRLLASEHGRAAEAAVARWLQEHSFDIVATNLRVGRYEIDVVARWLTSLQSKFPKGEDE